MRHWSPKYRAELIVRLIGTYLLIFLPSLVVESLICLNRLLLILNNRLPIDEEHMHTRLQNLGIPRKYREHKLANLLLL